ncbi:MAG: hypothetical protein IJ038_02800 [Clostridia bacterium]|nr:hypothetical protein [Clostridia bacterium]
MKDEKTEKIKGEEYSEDGARPALTGRWVLDASYRGKDKAVYRCSLCDHWQSAKKRQDKMFYMNYCPFCGARMTHEKERVENA